MWYVSVRVCMLGDGILLSQTLLSPQLRRTSMKQLLLTDPPPKPEGLNLEV